MKGQGTETFNPGAYDLRNTMLDSKPLSSSWAPSVTPSFLLYFRDGGTRPSGVSRLGSSMRPLGSQMVCCPATPSPSPLQEGFFPCSSGRSSGG